MAGEPSVSSSAAAAPSGFAANPSADSTVPASIPATPAERLAAALAPLQVAAEFETSVTVDGSIAVTSVGRALGGARALTVTTAGKTVEYIQIPPQAWARQSGGSWVLVAVEEAPGSPLAVLSAPTTVEADPSSPSTLLATYAAASLGLSGDPVSVRITLGEAVVFRYQGDASGHPTVSETTIRATANLEPITAPS